MCKWGTQTVLNVPMPANLSHTGKFRWEDKPIDSCIAPIVQALNDAGVYTANCCCGHKSGMGSIMLHDGRELFIAQNCTVAKVLQDAFDSTVDIKEGE